MSKHKIHSIWCGILLLISLGSFAQISSETEYFQNPILAGWYPDPSITDDGKGNYYMVHSTFAYFPGIPIFHSTDLVNWVQIGSVLERPEQLELEGFGVSRGIFAPDISYDKGIFYVTCTMVDGKGNFVVATDDPAGDWSNPVWLPQVSGIDPGLFFDEDKSYLVYNSEAPDNKPEYEGHRTIRMIEFDKEKLQVKGDNRILVNGGVDIASKPIWAEGPRIYKRNGYYYLMTAEGGTAVNHSEMIYRNTHIDSEFIPYEKNPILTQRHLDPDREDPITSAGHADITRHPNGDWYGIFLAVRPYKGDYYNTGRETFLAPVQWVNDWPVFDLDGEAIRYRYPLPKGTSLKKELFPLNGNFSFTQEFDKEDLELNWLLLRTPQTKWYDLRQGLLTMKTRAETVMGTSNPSFIGHRQQHIEAQVSTKVAFTTGRPNEKAGLVAFQNDQHFYYLCKSVHNGRPVVELFKGTSDQPELIKRKNISSTQADLELQVAVDKDHYSFYYKSEGEWELLADDLEATYLSTKTAGGFVGVVFGLYTTSNGLQSSNTASFDWFTYSGNDAVYR